MYCAQVINSAGALHYPAVLLSFWWKEREREREGGNEKSCYKSDSPSFSQPIDYSITDLALVILSILCCFSLRRLITSHKEHFRSQFLLGFQQSKSCIANPYLSHSWSMIAEDRRAFPARPPPPLLYPPPFCCVLPNLVRPTNRIFETRPDRLLCRCKCPKRRSREPFIKLRPKGGRPLPIGLLITCRLVGHKQWGTDWHDPRNFKLRRFGLIAYIYLRAYRLSWPFDI